MQKILMAVFGLVLAFNSQGQELWSLEKCIEYAYNKNIEIKQGELQLENADVNRDQAVANMLPSINASAGNGWNWGKRIDPFTNEFASERVQSSNMGVSASLTVFNGFQNVNNVKQTKLDFEGQMAYLEQIRYDVALNVANAYLNVLFNEELLKIAETNLFGSDQQLLRVEKLVNAGALPEGNLSEIESQVASDEAKVVIAENNVDISYLALTQLMNMPIDEARTLRVSPPNLENVSSLVLIDSPDPVIGEALENFPSVIGARTDLQSAQLSLTQTKGGYSPRLSLSFSYGTGYSGNNRVNIGDDVDIPPIPIGQVQGTGEIVETFPTTRPADEYEIKGFSDQVTDNLNSSLFLNLSIPIFNGLTTRSNVQRAKISVENAEYSYELVKLRLSQDIQRAWTDARAAMKNHEAAEKAVLASERAFDYATVRFEQGVINTVEYSDSRVRLDNAKAELLRNKYDYLFKIKVLKYYQGQPLNFK